MRDYGARPRLALGETCKGRRSFHAEAKKSFAARGQLGDGPWERVT
jgi:hypothetical protein